jgi:hypothetical protein
MTDTSVNWAKRATVSLFYEVGDYRLLVVTGVVRHAAAPIRRPSRSLNRLITPPTPRAASATGSGMWERSFRPA